MAGADIHEDQGVWEKLGEDIGWAWGLWLEVKMR